MKSATLVAQNVPRRRGEHSWGATRVSALDPRVCGEHRRRYPSAPDDRFIPASAGNILVSISLIFHLIFKEQNSTKK